MKNILLNKAFILAERSHRGQTRKYNGDPYIVHPVGVMFILQHYAKPTENMLAAALLHDVYEDCGVSLETIAKEINPEVASLVDQVSKRSKKSDGNRAVRKEIDRKHYSSGTPQAQTIKCADMIYNTQCAFQEDPEFAKKYVPEQRALAESFTLLDSNIKKRLFEVIEEQEKLIAAK